MSFVGISDKDSLIVCGQEIVRLLKAVEELQIRLDAQRVEKNYYRIETATARELASQLSEKLAAEVAERQLQWDKRSKAESAAFAAKDLLERVKKTLQIVESERDAANAQARSSADKADHWLKVLQDVVCDRDVAEAKVKELEAKLAQRDHPRPSLAEEYNNRIARDLANRVESTYCGHCPRCGIHTYSTRCARCLPTVER